MLILLESATENSCREFFEYYEGSIGGTLDWYYFLAGPACTGVSCVDT